MNFYEFWWIWIFEREFFENHSEWVFVNMVFNIHCFTPFGVRGSLNKLQHSSFILFFTAFGTVSDDGFNNLVQKRHLWAKIVNFGWVFQGGSFRIGSLKWHFFRAEWFSIKNGNFFHLAEKHSYSNQIGWLKELKMVKWNYFRPNHDRKWIAARILTEIESF